MQREGPFAEGNEVAQLPSLIRSKVVSKDVYFLKISETTKTDNFPDQKNSLFLQCLL